MERTAVAFAPGHISGYFQRIDGDTPHTTGSCGAGLVIDHGVIATVRSAEQTSVVITEHHPTGNSLNHYGSSLIEGLLNSFGVTAAVETVASLPIGAGFGMSAAAVLATLTAANAVFDLGLTTSDIAEHAHTLEISHNTGLGDVAAAVGGGLDVRTAPGIAGVAYRMFPDADFCMVTFGTIFTPDIISSPNRMRRISEVFPNRLPKNLMEFMENSRQFAEASNFIPQMIRPILTACDNAGVPASMTMLGCGVFTTGNEALEILSKFGRVIPLKIYPHGPKLLVE